jgi:hypothetical protein
LILTILVLEGAELFKKSVRDQDGNLVLSDLKYGAATWMSKQAPKLMLQLLFPRLAVFGKLNLV